MKQSYQKSQSTFNLRHVCLIYHIYFMYPMKLLYKYHMFIHFMYHMKRSYHMYLYHLPVSIVMLCFRFLRQRRHLGSAHSARLWLQKSWKRFLMSICSSRCEVRCRKNDEDDALTWRPNRFNNPERANEPTNGEERKFVPNWRIAVV